MTRQSIDLGKNSLAKKMEARVRLAHARLGRRILYEGAYDGSCQRSTSGVAGPRRRRRRRAGGLVSGIARGAGAALSLARGKDHRAVPRRRHRGRDARIFSDWLAKKWGEPVVIEN